MSDGYRQDEIFRFATFHFGTEKSVRGTGQIDHFHDGWWNGTVPFGGCGAVSSSDSTSQL
jgi:hypothetical protein